MLARCVLGSGIKNKQAIKITEYNNYNIYYLKEWGEDGLKFVMFDGYLFPVGFNIEHVKKTLDNITDFKQTLIAQFKYTLRQCKSISLGLAQYLNRVDDAIKAKEKQKKREQEHEQQKQEEQEKREQELKELYEKNLKEAEINFINGKKIHGSTFVDLCDKYNIKLPIRTRGWCLKTLTYIGINGYQYKKGGNASTVIYKYIDKLKETIIN